MEEVNLGRMCALAPDQASQCEVSWCEARLCHQCSSGVQRMTMTHESHGLAARYLQGLFVQEEYQGVCIKSAVVFSEEKGIIF